MAQWPIGICQTKRTIPFVWALQLLFVLIIEIKSISNSVIFLFSTYLFSLTLSLFLFVVCCSLFSSSFWLYLFDTIKNWWTKIGVGAEEHKETITAFTNSVWTAASWHLHNANVRYFSLYIFLIVCSLGECFGHCYIMYFVRQIR